MSRKIRVLLSGPGLIGTRHADLLQRSKLSELVAIVNPSMTCSMSFPCERKIPLFASMQEAFDSVTVDAAIIASPNAFHAEQALFCIERGVPTLVEKPLAADLESAAAICAASKARGVPILVGHHRTYSALLSTTRNFLRSSEFGKMVGVLGSALFLKPNHYFAEGPWRTRIGGGPILINLIHEIGILRFLCGPIRSVSAVASHAQRSFEVEDTTAIIMRFENGALGTFLLSDTAASDKSWEMTSGENPAYLHSPDSNCYHFVGTNGSLDFPTLGTRFYGPDQTPSWWTPFRTQKLRAETSDPLEKQLAHFEDVILGRAEPLVPAQEGLENMRVLDAIQRAIESGGVIELIGPDRAVASGSQQFETITQL